MPGKHVHFLFLCPCRRAGRAGVSLCGEHSDPVKMIISRKNAALFLRVMNIQIDHSHKPFVLRTKPSFFENIILTAVNR
jgi:hypothetical protein